MILKGDSHGREIENRMAAINQGGRVKPQSAAAAFATAMSAVAAADAGAVSAVAAAFVVAVSAVAATAAAVANAIAATVAAVVNAVTAVLPRRFAPLLLQLPLR